MRYAKRLMRGAKLLQASIGLQRALIEAWAAPGRKQRRQRARGRDLVRDERPPLMSPGRFVAGTYRNRAGLRHYKVYAPASSHPGPLPLVVMLHGCSQDPDDFATGTGMNELAEELGFVVVYPAQSSRANRAKCWNWFDALHQQRDRGEPSLIAGITRKILRHGLDARRVYVAGLSAGGAMAAVMAAEYPEIYAATGIHSGLPFAVHAQSLPIIVFHGDQDTTVHPSNSDFAPAPGSRIVAERGERNGRSFTCTMHFDVRGMPTVEQWIVHGAGHAWVGGDPRGTFTDRRGPDASREMLRFFLLHRR